MVISVQSGVGRIVVWQAMINQGIYTKFTLAIQSFTGLAPSMEWQISANTLEGMVMKIRNLVVAALVLSAGLAMAKPYGDPGHKRGYERGDVMQQLEALALSAEQKDAIKEVFQSSKSGRKALRSEKRALFKQLHAQGQEGLTPAEIDRLSAEFGRLSAEGMRQRLSIKTSVAQILTAEQRQQWQKQQQEKREERRGHWREQR